MSQLHNLSDDQKMRLAKSLFNETWNYLDKLSDLDGTEKEMMIGTAHASRYFWGLIGQPLHFQRGEWMLAHVYTLLNRGESAIYHAQQCWKLTESEKIQDFDLAFAYEALARANALNNAHEMTQKYIKKAKDASELIKDKEDRVYFLNELEKGPWFGYTL